MIAEIWDYLTTPASKAAREEGHLYNSIALSHRARRCKGAWQPHLNQCQALVSVALREQQPESVCILGSGLLLETPPELFIEQKKIDYVDVVHNKAVRQSELDNRFRLLEFNLNEKFPQEKYDLIISANLLSQLPLARTDSEASRLQQKHWNWLKNCGAKVILYSDYQIQFLNLASEIVDTQNTISDSVKIPWQRQWLWDVAPIPEYQSDTALRLVVASTQL